MEAQCLPTTMTLAQQSTKNGWSMTTAISKDKEEERGSSTTHMVMLQGEEWTRDWQRTTPMQGGDMHDGLQVGAWECIKRGGGMRDEWIRLIGNDRTRQERDERRGGHRHGWHPDCLSHSQLIANLAEWWQRLTMMPGEEGWWGEY